MCFPFSINTPYVGTLHIIYVLIYVLSVCWYGCSHIWSMCVCVCKNVYISHFLIKLLSLIPDTIKPLHVDQWLGLGHNVNLTSILYFELYLFTLFVDDNGRLFTLYCWKVTLKMFHIVHTRFDTKMHAWMWASCVCCCYMLQ